MTDVTILASSPPKHFTEPQRIDVGGLSVAYRRKGAGSATVFLHGAGTTRMWLPFYEAMSGGVDFVAPEHPGFGDTARPDWLEGFDDLVLHYRDLLDAFGFDRVHLVGFSLGGWIAAELAVFYPDRLRSLTLVTPVGLSVPGHPITDLFRVPPERIGQLLYNDRAEEYAEFLPDPHDVDAAVRGYTEFTTLALLMWNPRSDRKLPRRLARVHCPALVVEPDEDRLVPREHFQRWAELLPDARLARVSGATNPTGHALLMQEPDRAAATIGGFLRDAEEAGHRAQTGQGAHAAPGGSAPRSEGAPA